MITQQQLTDRCTPEIIKKMVELAEGFECAMEDPNYLSIYFKGKEVIIDSPLVFSTLIHRAVEGWNNNNDGKISVHDKYVEYQKDRVQVLQAYMEMSYEFDEYEPTSLTHAECAMLHGLIEVLK